MLELAQRIAQGTLPAEPHYRAPLYPALLAGLLEAGVTPNDLPFAARALNGVLHLISTYYVWVIAAALWRGRAAAAVAVALFGLNPVVLHFVADPLDISFAMTLMLAGLRHGLRALSPAAGDQRLHIGLAAFFLALAVIARPQMLTSLAAWVILLLVALRRRPRAAPASWFALAPMVLVFILMGATNYRLAGDFRILPWQGAYNLWAANGPGANGRYFVQVTRIGSYTEGGNPARLESERLYRELQPGGPFGYASMSRFWYAKTWAAIADAPLRWLRLVADKTYYLLNNFEQYDIKTYHLHKALSPWLRWNPLCWAVVLAAGTAGFVGGRRHAGARALAWCALAYGSGLLLTYVSARFRLPLVPLMAILAGGIVHQKSIGRALRTAAIAGAIAVVSLLPLPPQEADRTLVQDYLLLSRAASALMLNDEAIDYARAALDRVPGDAAARELICVAAFNRWLRGEQRDDGLPVASCEDAAAVSPVARRILGIAYWRLGRDIDAVGLWQELLHGDSVEHDAALAALVMTNRVSAWYLSVDWSRAAEFDDVLLLALALQDHPQAVAILRQRMTQEDIARQSESLRRTFSRIDGG